MAETLAVDASREGAVGILRTDGYINDEAADRVAEAADGLIDEGVRHLVLNLQQTPIANSIGIAILIGIIEKLREQNGKVAFCCVKPILVKTFEIMGILKVASVHAVEAEAVEAVS